MLRKEYHSLKLTENVKLISKRKGVAGQKPFWLDKAGAEKEEGHTDTKITTAACLYA